jgi:menaquinone-9 beta-reductase
MNGRTDYDCAIIGGGVAGLALAILLAETGRRTILFEKEAYPYHKVCGEYISNESVNFLRKLGLDLSAYDLPRMDQLLLSSVSGISVKRNLSIGGIGFSRYRLDHLLAQKARAGGVEVRAKTKVRDVEFKDDLFEISFGDEKITARAAAGAYGKNSNIDARLDRTIRAPRERDLFIAVKHHLSLPGYNRTHVEMHNFAGGYCGLSAIEDDRVNMSYITRAENLRKCGNRIAELERRVLSKNPFLEKIIADAKFELEKPLVIAHLHFGLKTMVDAHLLMIGDAAGNIAPLSGNGISMALRSASIAAAGIGSFLDGRTSRAGMETFFEREYKKAFSARIRYARMVHKTFGKPFLNDLSFCFLKIFPFLVDLTQARIHGREF